MCRASLTKENKHESHMSSSETNSCVNLVWGKAKKTQKQSMHAEDWVQQKQTNSSSHPHQNNKLMFRKTAENENKTV